MLTAQLVVGVHGGNVIPVIITVSGSMEEEETVSSSQRQAKSSGSRQDEADPVAVRTQKPYFAASAKPDSSSKSSNSGYSYLSPSSDIQLTQSTTNLAK
ncbi:hypothetical protein L6452_11554 [Arctium lappa]|uniref:Uncharacterized protein n=1 Tax=Arctium lappa TaxID=4217 RepID=A0ACB9DPT3_ARCLA|nr:hypothetical protein L6452_11554 [Arctium lappa]